jgi:galactokinase/galacturonokinase
MMHDYRRSAAEFERQLGPGGPVRVVRAPYRVCPLGAHTDHQRGLVIGLTIEPAVHAFYRARPDRSSRVRSREFPGEVVIDPGDARGPADGFGAYLFAVARSLAADRPVARGADVWIEGDLRPGGIGSSAAVQIAFLLALSDVNGVRLDRAAAMNLVMGAEREGAGVQIGLLDPAVILFGERDHLVYLDCAEGVPRVQKLAASLPRFEFLLFDSGVDRVLPGSPYNDRVDECRAAARALGATGDPPALREVTLEQFRRRRAALDPLLARRAEHVLAENKRVRNGLAALQQGDLVSFGRLVNASGRSMVQLFDAGTPETAHALTLLQGDADVFGATLSGAGFGGNLLAIVPPGGARGVFERVLPALAAKFPAVAARASFVASGTGPGAAVVSGNPAAPTT